MLSVRVHNACNIVAINIRPGIRSDRQQFLLEDVERRGKHPFILAEDFNAKQKSWCS